MESKNRVDSAEYKPCCSSVARSDVEFDRVLSRVIADIVRDFLSETPRDRSVLDEIENRVGCRDIVSKPIQDLRYYIIMKITSMLAIRCVKRMLRDLGFSDYAIRRILGDVVRDVVEEWIRSSLTRREHGE